VAKHSKDATNNPPTLRPKLLLPLCSRNIISFCTDKGVIYQWTSYLKLLYLKLISWREKNLKEIKTFTWSFFVTHTYTCIFICCVQIK